MPHVNVKCFTNHEVDLFKFIIDVVSGTNKAGNCWK